MPQMNGGGGYTHLGSFMCLTMIIAMIWRGVMVVWAPAGMDVALFGFDARVPHGVPSNHTLSIIITDCSLANNLSVYFLFILV